MKKSSQNLNSCIQKQLHDIYVFTIENILEVEDHMRLLRYGRHLFKRAMLSKHTHILANKDIACKGG